MGHGPDKTPLTFGAYPDKGTDPGISINFLGNKSCIVEEIRGLWGVDGGICFTGYQHSVTTNLWWGFYFLQTVTRDKISAIF